MNTKSPPPLLIGAVLLFWGWQSDLLIPGAIMALVLEGARVIKIRWDFSDEDFSRIWTFCALLFLASGTYAFTLNHGPTNLGEMMADASLAKQNDVGISSARTAVLAIRWLPMAFFLFIVAQTYSNRAGIPLETISLILRRRWKKAREAGEPLPTSRVVDVGYPYFILCLFAATTHPAASKGGFFWGLCALTAWTLWVRRSPRFGIATWIGVLAVAMFLAYGGQRGLMRLQGIVSRYNPQWFADWMRSGTDSSASYTAIGRIGQMKMSHQIVLRLETAPGVEPPAYLREATYRGYRPGKASVWDAGSARDDFVSVSETPANSGKWPLLPGVTNKLDLQIACYLANPDNGSVLPLPEDSGTLEQLPMFTLQNNSVGTVRGTGPGMVIFHAHYGSGSALDAPPKPSKEASTNEDTFVPDKEKVALDEVIKTLPVADKTSEQIVSVVGHYFATQYTYTLWQDRSKNEDTNLTPIGRFLLKTHSGHCEYFATATVLMLRELKIPARYAVGYAVHESSGGNKYVVRGSDAHAWCRVWNDRVKQWEDLDTTPGTWVAAESKLFSPLQFIGDVWSRLVFEFSKFRWGQTNLRQYIIWALVPILAFLLYQIIFRSNRRRAKQSAQSMVNENSYPGLDSEIYRLEFELVKRGMSRRANESFSVWLRRAAAEPGFAKVSEPLQHVLSLHYRYRFDPRGLNPEERQSLRREVATCLSRLD